MPRTTITITIEVRHRPDPDQDLSERVESLLDSGAIQDLILEDIPGARSLSAQATYQSRVAPRNCFRIHLVIFSDADPQTPVATARLVLMAASGKDARIQAVARTHEEHPAADERIHPIVRVKRTERVPQRIPLGWESDKNDE
jgi:hypothetical protein